MLDSKFIFLIAQIFKENIMSPYHSGQRLVLVLYYKEYGFLKDCVVLYSGNIQWIKITQWLVPTLRQTGLITS